MTISFEDLTPKQFLEHFLSILSSLQTPSKQLSKVERKVLVEFCLLPSRFSSFPFSQAGKNRVLSSLRKSSSFTSPALHAKIYSLIRKGYLKRDEDKVILIQPSIRAALASFLSGSKYLINFSFTLDNSVDIRPHLSDFPTA